MKAHTTTLANLALIMIKMLRACHSDNQHGGAFDGAESGEPGKGAHAENTECDRVRADLPTLLWHVATCNVVVREVGGGKGMGGARRSSFKQGRGWQRRQQPLMGTCGCLGLLDYG